MDSAVKIYLKSALTDELPGGSAHSKMLPPGRRLKQLENELSSVKQSSVLVLLYPEENKIYTCLTRRPSTMKYHPGQISFPGGKVEKEDASAEMAALREAHEEVGIDTSEIEVLGKLSDFYLEISRFSIQPFLAWTDKRPEFTVNTDEVEELILFPVSDFVEKEIVQETELQTMTGILPIKYFPYNGQVIWGATAMILAELIEIMRKQNQILV
jgi:8-oxo-dGTP pyrophosphatase MutT (NUDIX family)